MIRYAGSIASLGYGYVGLGLLWLSLAPSDLHFRWLKNRRQPSTTDLCGWLAAHAFFWQGILFLEGAGLTKFLASAIGTGAWFTHEELARALSDHTFSNAIGIWIASLPQWILNRMNDYALAVECICPLLLLSSRRILRWIGYLHLLALLLGIMICVHTSLIAFSGFLFILAHFPMTEPVFAERTDFNVDRWKFDWKAGVACALIAYCCLSWVAKIGREITEGSPYWPSIRGKLVRFTDRDRDFLPEVFPMYVNNPNEQMEIPFEAETANGKFHSLDCWLTRSCKDSLPEENYLFRTGYAWQIGRFYFDFFENLKTSPGGRSEEFARLTRLMERHQAELNSRLTNGDRVASVSLIAIGGPSRNASGPIQKSTYRARVLRGILNFP